MICFQYKPEKIEDAKKMIDTYFSALNESKITDDQMIFVSGKLLLTWTPSFGRKFPTVKEFLDISGLSASSIAEKAHKAIKNAILRVGAYEVLFLGNEHRHAVAHECIRQMGGWPKVCQSGLQDWDKQKERFCKIFEEKYYEKIENKPVLCLSDNKNIEYSKQLAIKNIY